MSPSGYRKTHSSSSSSSSSLLSVNPSPSSSSSFSLPYHSSNSSGSPGSASRRSRRQVRFSHAELIDSTSFLDDATRAQSLRKAPLQSEPRSTLKRCPTPVLTSLAELASAHCHQLSTVWKESASALPSLEADQRAIAASRRGELDPFDF